MHLGPFFVLYNSMSFSKCTVIIYKRRIMVELFHFLENFAVNLFNSSKTLDPGQPLSTVSIVLPFSACHMRKYVGYVLQITVSFLLIYV